MTWLNTNHPANAKVLLALGNGRRQDVSVTPADDTLTPCKALERLWNELGSTLPDDARCLLNGTPALVHPASGIVLAVCVGKDYALRVPPGLNREAESLGLRKSTVTTRFGADWLLGNWQPREVSWLRRVYRFHDEARTPAAVG